MLRRGSSSICLGTAFVFGGCGQKFRAPATTGTQCGSDLSPSTPMLLCGRQPVTGINCNLARVGYLAATGAYFNIFPVRLVIFTRFVQSFCQSHTLLSYQNLWNKCIAFPYLCQHIVYKQSMNTNMERRSTEVEVAAPGVQRRFPDAE